MRMTAAALERLLHEQHPKIRAVCLRILGNHADADDAAQEALIRISRSIDSFDGRSNVNTWVYRIATNAALDELRRRSRRPLSLVDGDPNRPDPTGEAAFARIDSSGSLDAALAAIPDEYRVAMVLRDVADLDYDEIAEVLGVPGGTVRSRIARGRGRLADILGNPGDPPQRQTSEPGRRP